MAAHIVLVTNTSPPSHRALAYKEACGISLIPQAALKDAFGSAAFWYILKDSTVWVQSCQPGKHLIPNYCNRKPFRNQELSELCRWSQNKSVPLCALTLDPVPGLIRTGGPEGW